MKAFVTGGTGFIGSHVVRVLLDKGYEVVALTRSTSRLNNLKDLPLKTVTGDLRDIYSLRTGMRGCDVVYHVAADYRFWSPQSKERYDINVQGTENILQSALEEKVSKVVYTSTVGTIGNKGDGTPGTEDTPVSIEDMVGDYKRSKFLAERKAIEYSQKGLFVVIVNPSAPVGPNDIKPTPTGQTILNYLNGKMPAYIDTGLNLVAVEDVALGNWLAERKGRNGERYILGNEDMTLKNVLDLLEKITGIPAPKTKIPYWVALTAGYCNQIVSDYITHKEPGIPLEPVKMAKKKMFFDSSKAIRELGFPQSSPEEALRRAVEWFLNNGYVTSSPQRH